MIETYIPILIGLLALSAFFSSAETAFISIQRVHLEHAVREGDRGAGRVGGLLERPGRLLSAILLGNNLVNTGAAAVGTAIAAELVAGGAAVLIATLAITALLVVFGEVGPKTVALHHAFPVSKIYAVPMSFWTTATRPVVWVLELVSRVFLRLVGESPRDLNVLTVGELETAIAMGTESGTIEEEQSSMMLGALKLQDLPARRIMTPRVDMVMAEVNETVTDVGRRIAEHGFLRLPVYEETPEEIVGYVHVSDVCDALVRGRPGESVREILRSISFEPEFAPAARVLERMQESDVHLVILLDEHGSTSGLVTLEDLLEEVVGEIRSESGYERPALEVSDFNQSIVEGRTALEDLSDELDVDLAHPEADTAAGLMLAELRRFPVPGEYVDFRGYRFTALEVDDRRVLKVAIDRLPDDAGGDE